jgi:hypothetical protein
LFLQLLAHSYFLDRGELEKAGEELAQAAKVYSDSAGDAPVEFATSFVFGSAYIWRSADVARQWWAHVEAKKPRLNSDYWLTRSALQWVEGDLSIARESLEKAVALANSLPNAGAYEFERYRCSLMPPASNTRRVVKRCPPRTITTTQLASCKGLLLTLNRRCAQ